MPEGVAGPTGPEAGLEATVELLVTEAMTARALGSGDVPVLATPAVLALAERAARLALRGRIGNEDTSVGSWAELSHLAPTPPGVTVSATARLVEVDGRRLTFQLVVRDGTGEIATGRHGRVVVRRERFLRTASRRAGGRGPRYPR
jgi:fluoroacetyl-CoA thioesterase